MLTEEQKKNLARLDIPMDERKISILNDHLDDALEQHNKVFAVRMDIHTPGDPTNNTIRKFTQRFIQEEKRKGYDPSYVTVHEISENGVSHYHSIILYNGNKTQSPFEHFATANRVINNVMNLPQDEISGMIDTCQHSDLPNGIMIRRGDPDLSSLNDVARQASYLGKKSQKENVTGRTIFSSRLKGKKNSSLRKDL